MSSQVKLNRVESSRVESSRVESSQVKSSQVKSSQIKLAFMLKYHFPAERHMFAHHEVNLAFTIEWVFTVTS